MKSELRIVAVLLITLLMNSCKKTNSDPSPVPQIACLPTNLQDSLIAFYPFSLGSLNDISGNNYNLTNSTSASSGVDRAGNPNCAFNFVRANGDFLKYANPTFLNDFQTIPFSISLWYKPIGIDNDYKLLIGRDSTLFHCDTYGQWSVGTYDVGLAVFGINQSSLWENGPTTTNVWKHLIVTCTGTDIKLYTNGILTTDVPGVGCPTPTTNAGDLLLGKEFNGLLDDVIIYKKILSSAEITQLYNLAACCQ